MQPALPCVPCQSGEERRTAVVVTVGCLDERMTLWLAYFHLMNISERSVLIREEEEVKVGYKWPPPPPSEPRICRASIRGPRE